MTSATEGIRAASAGVPARRGGLLTQIAEHRWDYIYVLPALAVMLVVIAFPIYYTIELSFFKTPPNLQMRDKVFVGLDNYVTVLTSRHFHQVTVQTFIWTLASTFFSFLLGLAAALALHRDFAGRGLLRAIFLIPYVVSAVAASYVWKWLYHSDFGVIGALSVQLGLTDEPINFIDNTQTVLASLIVVNVWREFPFAMVMLMAGLQTVPEQLLRAAQVDGAGAWNRFRHVTMPHLQGVSMVTILLLMVANFNSFIIPWIMTSGGPAGASEILDHRHLQPRLRPAALWHRLGLRGDPLRGDDAARLLLREGAHPRRRGARAWLSARSRARRSTGGAGPGGW